MILTYYQAVELMTFLPVLLSSTDAKVSPEADSAQHNAGRAAVEDDPDVYEMWRYTSPGIEVNGADFY